MKHFYMNRFYLPLNLQLFAEQDVVLPNGEKVEIDPAELGGSDDIDDIEVVDDDEVQTTENDDEQDDQGTEEDTETVDEQDQGEAEKEVTPKKEPDATAKAVMAERQRWQKKLEEAQKTSPLIQKLMRLSGVQSVEELQAKLDAAEAATIAKQQNISPEQAQRLIQEQREKDELKREVRRLKYSQELQQLKSDPFFADIEDYREEFEEIAERTGMTLEEVYMSKRGRVRMKEMEREIEERVKSSQSKKQKAKVDTTADGAQTKAPKIDLRPDLLEAAKFAVKNGTFKNLNEAAAYYKKYAK